MKVVEICPGIKAARQRQSMEGDTRIFAWRAKLDLARPITGSGLGPEARISFFTAGSNDMEIPSVVVLGIMFRYQCQTNSEKLSSSEIVFDTVQQRSDPHEAQRILRARDTRRLNNRTPSY